MRYGLEGPSANRVGVSTPLVYSPCTYIVLVSLRPGPLSHCGWQRLMNFPAASGSFAGIFFVFFGLMLEPMRSGGQDVYRQPMGKGPCLHSVVFRLKHGPL